jgi:hypothetical protein
MQRAGSSSLVDRLVGVARLDVPTYEAIEHDQSATPTAAGVVALAAIATGLGSLDSGGVTGLIGGILSAIIGWAVFAAVAFFVGTRLLAVASMNVSLGQVLRTLGFAYAPLLAAFLGFIPGLGALLVLAASIWFLVTATVALRQAFDISTGRAIATAVISFIPAGIIAGLVQLIFGIGR